MKQLGYQINLLSKLMKQELTRLLIKYELTPAQYAVLKQLEIHPQQPAVKLASQLYFDKPTMSGIVNRLTEKQLIMCNPHPSDKRIKLLALTVTGQQLISEIEELNEQVVKKAIRHLDTEAVDVFEQLLGRMISNFEEGS